MKTQHTFSGEVKHDIMANSSLLGVISHDGFTDSPYHVGSGFPSDERGGTSLPGNMSADNSTVPLGYPEYYAMPYRVVGCLFLV